MTDGHWTIKQYAPNNKTGFTVTEVPVASRLSWEVADHALVIFGPGKTEQHYPWASIVHAEYQPPNPLKEGENQ